MNTKQIIHEVEKEFDEKFTCGGITGTVAFRKGKDRPYEIKKFIHSYTRKLIESLAEEVIGEDEDYRGHSAVNDFKAKQRLKVKEILSNLK